MREIRNAYKILAGKHEGKDHLGNVGAGGNITWGVVGRIILKQTFKKRARQCRLDSTVSRDRAQL
jgi:hypothetical protein